VLNNFVFDEEQTNSRTSVFQTKKHAQFSTKIANCLQKGPTLSGLSCSRPLNIFTTCSLFGLDQITQTTYQYLSTTGLNLDENLKFGRNWWHRTDEKWDFGQHISFSAYK